MRRTLTFILIAIFALGSLGLMANAGANDNPGVCAGSHITPSGDTKAITVTAPEGKLISAYCVKAGSLKQGNGPVYVTVDPPTKTVTISHPSGKDISHYTVTFVVEPTTPTTEPESGLIPPISVDQADAPKPVQVSPTFTG